MTAGEWQVRAFEDVIDFREGPGILARDFRDNGVPLVRLSGLNRGVSVLEGCDFLDPDTVSTRWSHFQLDLGDILLSTSASLGRIAVVGQEGVGAVPYTGIIRIRPKGDSLYAPYIRYLLEGPDFQEQAEMVGVGSVIRHFGPMHLRQMTVQFPPLPEQRAIAHILGTLDDKVELNRRMNETLEAMARALFKSWFVDFDPVRAKMEGRWRPGESLAGLPAESLAGLPAESLAGLPADLYDLFPDSLVDSELGDIPEGWEVKPLGGVLRSTNERVGDQLVAEYACTTDGLVPRSEMFTKRLSRSAAKNKIVRRNQLVFGLSRRVLNFGLMKDHIGCVSPVYRTYSVDDDVLLPELLEEAMRANPDYFYLAVSSSSREGQSVSEQALFSLEVVVPEKSVQHTLHRMIQDFSKQSTRMYEESLLLANQRDALLPKLMSGEMKVVDLC